MVRTSGEELKSGLSPRYGCRSVLEQKSQVGTENILRRWRVHSATFLIERNLYSGQLHLSEFVDTSLSENGLDDFGAEYTGGV